MEKRKPNLLLIMADQMHKYALGAVTPYVKTPNLDRLAAVSYTHLGYRDRPP